MPLIVKLKEKLKMTRDEVEAVLKAKIETGDADTGLYDTGTQYVVVDIVNEGNGDQMTFCWFDTLHTVDDVMHG